MIKRKISLSYVVLCIYLLLEARFFYLIPKNSLYSGFNYKSKTVIALFCIIAFVLFMCKEKKLILDKRLKWIWAMLLYIGFESLRNVHRFDMSFYEIFSLGHGFLLLLLYPIIAINSDEESQKKIINVITVFSIILSTLFLTQSFAYKLLKITFLHIKEYPSLALIQKRSYGIRMTVPGTLIIFSTLISFGQILGKKKGIHILNCILGMLYIVLVCQTRMTTLAIIATFMIILSNKIFENRFKYLKEIMVIIIAIFIFILPFRISEIFENNHSGSVYAREYAVKYYMESFLKHPLFGVGCLENDTKNHDILLIMHGSKGYANTTDVGYIGYIFQYGIVGIVLLLFLLKNIINIIKKVKNKNEMYYSTITCLLYILLTCGTLSIFDTQRIVMLPIILYMLNCLEINENEKEFNN